MFFTYFHENQPLSHCLMWIFKTAFHQGFIVSDLTDCGRILLHNIINNINKCNTKTATLKVMHPSQNTFYNRRLEIVQQVQRTKMKNKKSRILFSNALLIFFLNLVFCLHQWWLVGLDCRKLWSVTAGLMVAHALFYLVPPTTWAGNSVPNVKEVMRATWVS